MIRVSGSWVLPFCQTPRLPFITITIVCLLSSEIKEKERLRSILSVNKPSLYKCFRYNNNVNIVNSCHFFYSIKKTLTFSDHDHFWKQWTFSIWNKGAYSTVHNILLCQRSLHLHLSGSQDFILKISVVSSLWLICFR